MPGLTEPTALCACARSTQAIVSRESAETIRHPARGVSGLPPQNPRWADFSGAVPFGLSGPAPPHRFGACRSLRIKACAFSGRLMPR